MSRRVRPDLLRHKAEYDFAMERGRVSREAGTRKADNRGAETRRDGESRRGVAGEVRVSKHTTFISGEFVLIGKETERGWEQSEDISTLLPSLRRYEPYAGIAKQLVRELLQMMSLNALQKETGLSRNTILRARRGERLHMRSLQRLWDLS